MIETAERDPWLMLAQQRRRINALQAEKLLLEERIAELEKGLMPGESLPTSEGGAGAGG